MVSALSTDAFSGICLNGFLKEKSTPLSHKLRVPLFLVVSNVLLAMAGFGLGRILSSLLDEFSHILSLGLLFILGLKFIIKSFKPKFQEMTWELTNIKILTGFAFASGINAFLLGLALPGLNVLLLTLVSTLGIVFLISSIAALITGVRSNNFLLASRLLLSGGILIAGVAVYYIIKNSNLF